MCHDLGGKCTPETRVFECLVSAGAAVWVGEAVPLGSEVLLRKWVTEISRS